jgi:murein DD-endopeptidase MepM/ murein hydrolase activator NlpD
MNPLLVILIPFLLILLPPPAGNQKPYPKSYFRSPVNYEITLAGSFGEPRKNHIHSGIDIRTGGVEGKPVFAIADGYVSRINISSSGFGKAIYITHPNGYVSVYGHLSRLNDAIGRFTRSWQ